MKWDTKQVEEMLAIKNLDGWVISDLDGVLVKGASGAMLVNALTVFLSNGYYIECYSRSFSDNMLRIYIDT